MVDEVEEALALGYDRISFADDVFTLDRERVIAICDEISRRGLRFAWECLGRVDGIDGETAQRMREAGCSGVFFGIESGNDEILHLMNKRITTEQARAPSRRPTGPGSRSAPSSSSATPARPTTQCLTRCASPDRCRSITSGSDHALSASRDALCSSGWTAAHARVAAADGGLLLDQQLTFASDFSAAKMRFAILEGQRAVRDPPAPRELAAPPPLGLRGADGPVAPALS